MDLITIISICAATITTVSFIYFVVMKVRRFMKAVDTRLDALEDSFKIREELVLKEEIVVMHEDNRRTYTLKPGTVVIVYNIVDDIVEFVTKDRLITAKANINNFKQEYVK